MFKCVCRLIAAVWKHLRFNQGLRNICRKWFSTRWLGRTNLVIRRVITFRLRKLVLIYNLYNPLFTGDVEVQFLNLVEFQMQDTEESRFPAANNPLLIPAVVTPLYGLWSSC